MRREDFMQLVADAIDALPVEFRAKLDNVEIVVEDWPNQDVLKHAGVRHPAGSRRRAIP